MQVDSFYQSVNQLAYRIVPDAPSNDPLDPSFSALTDQNRWNLRDEPTLYLGTDPRVMATEWTRHVAEEIRDPALAGKQELRRIFEVWVQMDLVLDLRDPALCETLTLQDSPFCFASSNNLCQQTSSQLRTQTNAQALLVPAIGLIDQLERGV